MATSSKPDKDKLLKRLRYLWTGELFNSFFLPAVAVFSTRMYEQPMGLFAIYSAGLVAWLLWQGTAYWLLKLRAVQRDAEIEAKHLRRFGTFQVVNWILIGALPLLLLVRGWLAGSPFSSTYDLIAGLAFYTLAVLEQVNYYHYQLMYDYPADWQYLLKNKRLKRPSLYRAMQSAGRPEAG